VESRNADIDFGGGIEQSAGCRTVQKDHEIEVKFTCDPATMERVANSHILRSGADMRVRRLRTIYFDTPSDDLRKSGIVLRIRKKDHTAAVLGFKSASIKAGGSFARKEVEVPSPDLQPNLALFAKKTAADVVRIIGDRPLEPKFETQINRQTIVVSRAASCIEVALDEGHIVYGEQRVPLSEIELELKSGDEAFLYDLATELAKEFSLSLDFVSKGEKGFRTCGKESAAPVKAESIRLKSGATVDDTVTAILANTLAQFVANWAALRETERPESIHQLRVALRRLRSGLLMFKKVLPKGEFDDLRQEAKRIASALGPAREWDVLRASVEQMPLLRKNCPESCEALLTALQDCRNIAYKDARSLINSRDVTIFVLKVQSLLTRRAWRKALTNKKQPNLNVTAKKFAKRTLNKFSERVLKRGSEFPDLSDEARHKLRIALKNLRYSVEFFGSLFNRPRKVTSYVGHVTKLQDLIGTQNDVVMAREFLDKLSSTTGVGLEKASGFILGWYASKVSAAEESLCSSWKKFKQTDAFWD
jgi:inorganic triphosphatase YgiF